MSNQDEPIRPRAPQHRGIVSRCAVGCAYAVVVVIAVGMAVALVLPLFAGPDDDPFESGRAVGSYMFYIVVPVAFLAFLKGSGFLSQRQ